MACSTISDGIFCFWCLQMIWICSTGMSLVHSLWTIALISCHALHLAWFACGVLKTSIFVINFANLDFELLLSMRREDRRRTSRTITLYAWQGGRFLEITSFWRRENQWKSRQKRTIFLFFVGRNRSSSSSGDSTFTEISSIPWSNRLELDLGEHSASSTLQHLLSLPNQKKQTLNYRWTPCCLESRAASDHLLWCCFRSESSPEFQFHPKPSSGRDSLFGSKRNIYTKFHSFRIILWINDRFSS